MEGIYTNPRGCDATNDVTDVREDNAMGMVVKGEDEEKLRYLTSAMTASRSSRKSTYETWLGFSMKRRAAGAGALSSHSCPTGCLGLSCCVARRMC